jgi:hypothetical protein
MIRVRRRDGSIIDADDDYVMENGESIVFALMLICGAL